MNSNFSASAVLVKTERSRAPGRLASFENAYDPFDSVRVRLLRERSRHPDLRGEDGEEEHPPEAVRPARRRSVLRPPPLTRLTILHMLI